jgi:hypothetical protein
MNWKVLAGVGACLALTVEGEHAGAGGMGIALAGVALLFGAI